MRRAFVLAVLVAALAGVASPAGAKPRTLPLAPSTAVRPALVSTAAVGYVVKPGLVLWVEPSGIGRIVGGDGVCAHLVGSTAKFYKRVTVKTAPGFKGLVCNSDAAEASAEAVFGLGGHVKVP